MESGWVLKNNDHERAADLSELLDIDETLIRVLCARGIKTTSEIIDFLNPSIADMHSPFLFSRMDSAVDRLRKAVSAGEKVAVFADSDLDGITSMTIISSLLTRTGITPLYRYLKNDETYGITRSIIDEFIEQGIDLLITVDSGTRDIDEIAYATDSGIDVIVTDHHEPDSVLPDAIIINPKIHDSGYPFRHLAGAGVALKLCHAFLLSYLPWYNRSFILLCRQEELASAVVIRNGIEHACMSADSVEELLKNGIIPDDQEYSIIYDSETIEGDEFTGCSCDVMSLDEFAGAAGSGPDCPVYCVAAPELYTKIYRDSISGIDLMKKRISMIQAAASPKINEFMSSALGLVAIGTVADVVPLVGENRILVHAGMKCLEVSRHPGLSMLRGRGPVSSKTIGWEIAPLLNTPGRFGLTGMTVNFFLNNNRDEAERIISEIQALNIKRKSTVNSICEGIMNDLREGRAAIHENMIFIKGEIPEGLVGLVANRISDSVKKPVIVASVPGRNGLVKGSGRCHSDFDFFCHVEKLSEHFDRVGGHPQAFGFTVKAENIEGVMDMIDASMNGQSAAPHEYMIDTEAGIEEITANYIDILSRLEPFGNANEEPLLMASGVMIDKFTRFGNARNHGKYTFRDNRRLSGIGWNMADKMEGYHGAGPVDMIFTLDKNVFNGSVYPRLVIQDIRFTV